MTALLLAVPLVLAGLLAGPARAAGGEGEYIVVLSRAAGSVPALAETQSRQYGVRPAEEFRSALKGYTATMTAAEAAHLRQDPAVAFVTPNRTWRLPADAQAAPAAQTVPTQVRRIGADRSSTRAGNGSGAVGINIATIDSGVDAGHPDLNVRGGVDCSSGSLQVPGNALSDSIGHGTMVAGVAAARDNAVGVVGTAPGARVWSARVVDSAGMISNAALVCAIDWVTSTRTDADPSNDIAVANMSIAGPGADDGQCGDANGDAVHAAVCGSVDAGVAYVVAAGNSTSDVAKTIPAAYDEVLTVTAMADLDGRPGGLSKATTCGSTPLRAGTTDDAAAPFSNFATSADSDHTIAAPGVCITSTAPGGAYRAGSGTSFASPAVTGVVALCLSTGKCPAGDPRATVEELSAAYNRTEPGFGFAGDPLRPTNGRHYGYLVAGSVF
ncbi:S8 family serine peptidase [Georgenia thermotolerans]|uniref:S8 family serine peptidase n=1 Tax=Georgenia thermotolerans TaxID=527326 RepID=UPI001D019D09|nr:S8 family serine peptidase [Georgenia thermotolerans]